MPPSFIISYRYEIPLALRSTCLGPWFALPSALFVIILALPFRAAAGECATEPLGKASGLIRDGGASFGKAARACESFPACPPLYIPPPHFHSFLCSPSDCLSCKALVAHFRFIQALSADNLVTFFSCQQCIDCISFSSLVTPIYQNTQAPSRTIFRNSASKPCS